MPWSAAFGDRDLDILETLEAVPTGIVVYDLDGRCVFLNRAAVSVFEDAGVEDPARFLAGGPWHELFPDARDAPFGRAFDAVVSGASDEVRADVAHLSDTVWDCHFQRLDDRVVVTFRDVTDAPGLADDFRLLVDDYPFGGVMVFDRDLRYVHAGGRGFDDIDVDSDWMVGKTISEVWPPATAATLESHFRGALAGEETEVRIQYEGLEYLCWIAPLPRPGGRIDRGIIVTWEITEAVRVEQEHRLVRAAVEALDLGITIADVREGDLPLIFVSEGFTRLTGYDRAEILGTNCRFLQGEETDRDRVAKMRRALEQGESCQVTLRNYRRDGSEFWNRVSLFPMHDEGGELTHYLGVQEDVTEQRAMGVQLRNSERLSALGRLAGGVAHDIRNILTGAGGLLELALQNDDIPEEVVQDVREATNVLRRGTSVTNRLLTFARTGIVQEETVDLEKLLAERVAFLRRVLRDDVAVEFDRPDAGAWIRIDPGQLDQVFINLANNAADAMPDGGVLRFVLSRGPVQGRPPPSVDPDRHWVHVQVTDTGHGMDPATLESAFDPFFTTKDPGVGTGLGLPSVYGTVTQAGGACWIESEVGRGTTVHLLFPAVAGASAVEGTGRGRERPIGGGRAVLVVEDEPSVRAVCVRALEREGFRVMVAEDGRAGLATFRALEGGLDLLVTDAVMPSMSGVQLARLVHEEDPRVPILVMSGYTEEGLEGLDPDRVHFLAKPFDVAALVGSVREALAP